MWKKYLGNYIKYRERQKDVERGKAYKMLIPVDLYFKKIHLTAQQVKNEFKNSNNPQEDKEKDPKMIVEMKMLYGRQLKKKLVIRKMNMRICS